MPLHTALAKSKNMVSIRILQAVGTQNAQDWISRFGFDADKHPPYLTMALGAGSVTPMQMALGYAVFANGGYRINPWLITRITDQKGKPLVESQPPLLNESVRAIDARNAFVMDRLLQEVARSGTGRPGPARPQAPDLYGKTGTTNDSIDTWFNGLPPVPGRRGLDGIRHPALARRPGNGGGLSLPVWFKLHGRGAQGRAGDGTLGAGRPGQRRRRVVLRGITPAATGWPAWA
jgi:penicillin-binding protein 1A